MEAGDPKCASKKHNYQHEDGPPLEVSQRDVIHDLTLQCKTLSNENANLRAEVNRLQVWTVLGKEISNIVMPMPLQFALFLLLLGLLMNQMNELCPIFTADRTSKYLVDKKMRNGNLGLSQSNLHTSVLENGADV